MREKILLLVVGDTYPEDLVLCERCVPLAHVFGVLYLGREGGGRHVNLGCHEVDLLA